MKNKYKYLVAGCAIILFVLPYVLGSQLPSPNEPRDCYKWGQTEGLYMCFVPETGEYATWFDKYETMRDYYTPQLKETAWNVGNMQEIGKKTNVQVGTMTITGNPSYTYTKHV